MAAKGGPSPLIPLLLVVSLGLLLRMNDSIIFPINLNPDYYLPLLAEISDAENAIFMFVLCVPFLVALAVYSSSHSIVLPIALVLVTYTVATVLLGPLVLILIVYMGGVWLPCFKCDSSEEFGLGCLLVLVFFFMQRSFSDEGGRSGAVILAVVIFFCYHFSP
ncbi:hypothetical protein ACP275_05G120100 [Erythranthe tilingii]